MDIKDIDREIALANKRINELEQTRRKMLDGYTEKGQEVIQELLDKGYPLKEKKNHIQYIIEGRKNLSLAQILPKNWQGLFLINQGLLN